MSGKNNLSTEPSFTRGDIATILNVTPLTIANREKNEKYPEPSRDLNNYRIYSIDDIFDLQILTYGSLDPRPVISVLYDKGYREEKELGKIIDAAVTRRV